MGCLVVPSGGRAPRRPLGQPPDGTRRHEDGRSEGPRGGRPRSARGGDGRPSAGTHERSQGWSWEPRVTPPLLPLLLPAVAVCLCVAVSLPQHQPPSLPPSSPLSPRCPATTITTTAQPQPCQLPHNPLILLNTSPSYSRSVYLSFSCRPFPSSSVYVCLPSIQVYCVSLPVCPA